MGGLLADCFSAAMKGDSESDSFDALVIREGVPWRQVVILRSYAKYLQQLGTTNSYGFIAETLLANVRATRALLKLFAAKFDPELAADERLHATAESRQELLAAIDDVPVLGDIPIDVSLREGGDSGKPVVEADPTCPSAQALVAVAEKLSGRGRNLAGMQLGLTPTSKF